MVLQAEVGHGARLSRRRRQVFGYADRPFEERPQSLTSGDRPWEVDHGDQPSRD